MSVNNADTDGCDGLVDGRPIVGESVDRASDGDERTADRRGSGAAIGVEHVAIDVQCALPQSIEVHRGPKAAANQPLDFLGPAGGEHSLPVGARVGRRGQHVVLGREPASARTAHPAWNIFLNRDGAEDPGVTQGNDAGAARVLLDVELEAERT